MYTNHCEPPLAVFILQTYNASSDHFTSSYIKTGERRVVRLDKLNRLFIEFINP